MFSNYSFITEYWPLFIHGLVTTIELAVISIVLGLLLGITLAVMKMSKANLLSLIAKTYIGFIRNTPLLVQIYIVYIGLPQLLGFSVNDFVTGIVALTLYSGAYIAEIIRSGIQSLPVGQTEAAESLGIPSYRILLDIILPQAFKNILPALGNKLIGNVKDSSLVSVLGITDVMFAAQTVRGSTALGLEPMIIASALYLVICLILNQILALFERRMRHDA